MAISDYPEKLKNGYYRVREMWEDASTQAGAYKVLANAIAACDKNPGTYVFDTEGNIIYPEETGEEESGIEDESGLEESGDETEETNTPETGEGEAGEEFPEAVEYENDGNDVPIAYTKLSTLMNVRVGNDIHADIVATYKNEYGHRGFAGMLQRLAALCLRRIPDGLCLCEQRRGFLQLRRWDQSLHGEAKGEYQNRGGECARRRKPVYGAAQAERP